MALDNLRYSRAHVVEELNRCKEMLRLVRNGFYGHGTQRQSMEKADAERRVKYWLRKLEMIDRRP